MAFKKNNPGCPCCESVCKIDSFAGPVSVSGEVIRSKQHPQSPYPLWLQAEIMAEAGTVARLYFAWTESEPADGVYLEFEPNTPTADSGTVTFYRADGTQLGFPWIVDGAVSDDWHVFTVCLDPDTEPNEAVVCVDPADVGTGTGTGVHPSQCTSVILPDTAGTGTGTGGGFSIGRQAGYGSRSAGTGTGTGSGAVQFRNYKFERLWYLRSAGRRTNISGVLAWGRNRSTAIVSG